MIPKTRNGSAVVVLPLKNQSLQIQIGQCLVNNRWRSARAKGYSLERDVVNFYRQQGSFALRVGSQTREYQRRAIDGIAYHKGVFIIWQAKRRKKYLTKGEIQELKTAATQFGATAVLWYRDRGLRFEPIG